MGQFLTDASDRFGGFVFLGFVALPFLLIFITHSEHWWALIPGGVLLTLAGVTLVPDDSVFSGGLFFIGLSLTFAMVYLLTKSVGRQQWALYPAGILFLIGIVTLLGAADLVNFALAGCVTDRRCCCVDQGFKEIRNLIYPIISFLHCKDSFVRLYF